jgi:hypothetical protein
MGQTERRHYLFLAGIVALFLLVIAKWAMAELWYDEILSLELFVLGANSLGEVFSNYVIANNHFLSNGVEYVWMSLLGRDILGSELLVRLPSLVWSVATILVAGLCWRRHCGKRAALGAAMMLAVSPVFCSFAWQMRGYSLAMLLACLAVTAGADSLVKRNWRNQTVLGFSSLLLPMVMPTAVMLPLVITLALAFTESRTGSWRRAVGAVIAPVVGGLLGLSYYASVWNSVLKASQEAGGWTSFWCVLAGVVLPLALHCLCYLPLLPGLWGKKLWAREDGSSSLSRLDLYAQGLLLASAVAVLAILLLRLPAGHFPFPRTFLVLLPAVTFAAAKARGRAVWLDSRLTFGREILLLAAIGCGLIFITENVNAMALRNAHTQQNLLTQYYKGKDDNRQLAAFLEEQCQENRRYLWLTPDIDGVTAEFYSRLYYHPVSDVIVMPSIVPVSRFQGTLAGIIMDNVFISARNLEEAETMLAKITPEGARLRLEPLHQTEFRTLFSVIQ